MTDFYFYHRRRYCEDCEIPLRQKWKGPVWVCPGCNKIFVDNERGKPSVSRGEGR